MWCVMPKAFPMVTTHPTYGLCLFTSKYIKNGAPKNEVSTPIGISLVVPKFRAIRSESTKKTPP